MRFYHAVAVTLLWCGTTAFAQYTNKSSVLDGSGTRATGGSITNLSAAGQPGGIAVSSGGNYVNQAGFLQTFFLKPAMDHDGDGLADEADMDNDNDGLADEAENSGSSFSPATATDPNVPDSDGDRMTDWQEAMAGTDPRDSNALLRITSIASDAGGRYVSWVARSNKSYRVLRSDDGTSPPTNTIAMVTANGFASPPWYVTTNSTTDAVAPTNSSIYAIRPLP